jgi:hypothetical protein
MDSETCFKGVALPRRFSTRLTGRRLTGLPIGATAVVLIETLKIKNEHDLYCYTFKSAVKTMRVVRAVRGAWVQSLSLVGARVHYHIERVERKNQRSVSGESSARVDAQWRPAS